MLIYRAISLLLWTYRLPNGVFPNKDYSCPVDDELRRHVVAVECRALEHFVKLGQLAGISYYAWWGGHGAKNEPYSIYRCGALTCAGREALRPR